MCSTEVMLRFNHEGRVFALAPFYLTDIFVGALAAKAMRMTGVFDGAT